MSACNWHKLERTFNKINVHFDAELNVTEAYQKIFCSIDDNSLTEPINYDDLAMPFFYVT